MFEDRAFRWLATIDSPGGAFDRYIESMQLHRHDITEGFRRGHDLWLDLDRLGAYWASFPEEDELVLFLVDRGESPSLDLDRLASLLPDRTRAIVVARSYRRAADDRVLVIGAPVESDADLDAKCGAHLARFIRLQPTGSPLNPAAKAFPDDAWTFDGVGSYEPVIDGRGTVTIEEDGLRYDFFSSLRSGSRLLLVVGQSALVRSQVVLPAFQRWTWSEDIPHTSAMVLNDPILYLDDTLNAGWWFGTRERDTAREMADIVGRTKDELGLEAGQVVFYGGSAGGFSSLHMAACLPGSIAVVDIPQIDMRRYQQVGEADRAAAVAFDVTRIADTPPELWHRIDVTERFAHERHVPDHLYLQNVRDQSHVADHYGYFVSRVSALAKEHGWAQHRAQTEMYSQLSLVRGGHFPLNRADTMERIAEFARIEVAPGAPRRPGWL
ncbi:hypothetical protein [Janibacter sp. UYMM211]|uniref:hypothetical protein n=1 Tax=Janibacter sp. UYMM211 TaxID=3156342 RepID=UPI003395965B